LARYAAALADIERSSEDDLSKKNAGRDAFQVIEEAREVIAQSAVAQAAARSVGGPEGEAVRRMQELRDRRDGAKRAFLSEYGKPIEKRNQQKLESLRGASEALDRQFGEAASRFYAAFPDYANLVVPEPVSAREASSILRSGEAILALYALEDRVLTWMIKPKVQVAFFQQNVKRDDLGAEIKRLRASLSTASPYDVRDAYQIYLQTVAPIEPELSGVDHLIIVPDLNVMLRVPFAALITSNRGPAYKHLEKNLRDGQKPSQEELRDDYPQISWVARRSFAISIVPSATALVVLRTHAKAPASVFDTLYPVPLVGIGDPLLRGECGGDRSGSMVSVSVDEAADEVRSMSRLCGAREELIADARALNAPASEALYMEDRANKPMVMSLSSDRLERARVIVFATHALLGGVLKGGRQPALVLTPPAKPQRRTMAS